MLTPIVLSQYNYTLPTDTTALTGASVAGAIFVFFFILIFYAIFFVYIILHLIALYNWGTNDSQYFEGGVERKKLWFWIMSFVPFGSIYYFFVVRPKVNRVRKGGMNNMQQPTYNQPQPEQQPMQPMQ